MPSFSTHVVAAVLSERPGFQRVELESGRQAYVLTELIGPVATGDAVIVNTTAVDLGLGTGGWDVVHWNLSRSEVALPGVGHIMKLRYTSMQADTGVAEEAQGYAPPQSLGGIPVVVCPLHSHLAAVAAGFAASVPGARLVYVMTDSAALPAALSDLVADLRAKGILHATVSAGQAFGGDHEAVNVVSGLDVAVATAGAQAIVVAPGPGTVGTGTSLGHGALEGASILDSSTRRGATAIVALRWSDADHRARHRGLSHHSVAVLGLTSERARVAVPLGEPIPAAAAAHNVIEVDVPDVVELLHHFGVTVTSMGRTPVDDPQFHTYAAAAGVLAASFVAET